MQRDINLTLMRATRPVAQRGTVHASSRSLEPVASLVVIPA